MGNFRATLLKNGTSVDVSPQQRVDGAMSYAISLTSFAAVTCNGSDVLRLSIFSDTDDGQATSVSGSLLIKGI